jgi:hypothetical protein
MSEYKTTRPAAQSAAEKALSAVGEFGERALGAFRPAGAPAPAGQGVAIAGMVVGILCLVFWFAGIFELVGIAVGIVLSAVGVARGNRGVPGKGMAIAGLVCSLVAILGYLLFGIFTLGFGLIL